MCPEIAEAGDGEREQGIHMRRREALAAAVAAMVAPGLRAQAQTPRRVAVVSGFGAVEMAPLLAGFRQTLNRLGWTEGRNIAITVHLSGGDTAGLDRAAAAALASNPEVIVAQGTPGLTAVRQASKSVPIVFNFVVDPVGQGLALFCSNVAPSANL